MVTGSCHHTSTTQDRTATSCSPNPFPIGKKGSMSIWQFLSTGLLTSLLLWTEIGQHSLSWAPVSHVLLQQLHELLSWCVCTCNHISLYSFVYFNINKSVHFTLIYTHLHIAFKPEDQTFMGTKVTALFFGSPLSLRACFQHYS